MTKRLQRILGLALCLARLPCAVAWLAQGSSLLVSQQSVKHALKGTNTAAAAGGTTTTTRLFTKQQLDTSFDNILDDGTGHINGALAERIWNWEQDRRKSKNLPKVEYSVRSGLRLVDSLVQQVVSAQRGGGGPERKSMYADLIQEGLSALLDTMSHYRDDGDSKADFEAVAREQIRRQLMVSLEEDARPVRLPAAVKATVKEARALMKSMTVSQSGQAPTLVQLAGKMDIPVSRLQDYLSLARTRTLSMESTIEIINPAEDAIPAFADQEDWELSQGMLLDNGKMVQRDELVGEYMDEMLQQEGDDEAWIQREQNAGPLQDLLPDMEGPSPDDIALSEMIRDDMSDFLASTLEPAEIAMLRLSFGLDSGKPLSIEEISVALSAPTEDVFAAVNGGLEKLRASYTSRYVGSYLDEVDSV